ncbi:MAG: hypothetical protein WAU36_01480 [Cyclobacteriaceae bacterium]
MYFTSGDSYNEKWIIQNIAVLPNAREDKVTMINLWDDLVSEKNDNNTWVI